MTPTTSTLSTLINAFTVVDDDGDMVNPYLVYRTAEEAEADIRGMCRRRGFFAPKAAPCVAYEERLGLAQPRLREVVRMGSL